MVHGKFIIYQKIKRYIFTFSIVNHAAKIILFCLGNKQPNRPTSSAQTQIPLGWYQTKKDTRPVELEIKVQDGQWSRPRQPEVHIYREQQLPRRELYLWNIRNCEDSWGRYPVQYNNRIRCTGPYPINSGWNNGMQGLRPNRQTWQEYQEYSPAVQSSPEYQNFQVSAASASSSSSSSQGGYSFSQSSSLSNASPNGPMSLTFNKVNTFGNAQGHAQGTSAAIQQNSGYQTQGSFSSGSLSGSSNGFGQSSGSSISSNRNKESIGVVNSESSGSGIIKGNANAGAVSIAFPQDKTNSNDKVINSNRTNRKNKNKNEGPFEKIISHITDSVDKIFFNE